MKFQFKKNAKPIAYSDDDFYALCNGYCEPEDLLLYGRQAEEVRHAQMVLEDFFAQARDAGLIEEM